LKNIFSSEKTRAEKTEFFLLSIRRLGVALLDAMIINLAFILANLIEYYPDTIKYDVIQTLIGRSFYTTALFIIIYAFFGLYNSLWEYAGLHEMVRCACAGVLSTLVCLAADFICDSFDLFNVNTFSLSIYFTSSGSFFI
jgi:FlaA1/EpsC-like NDP-sugar epimerase